LGELGWRWGTGWIGGGDGGIVGGLKRGGKRRGGVLGLCWEGWVLVEERGCGYV